MTGLLFLLIMQGMRHLYHWRLPGKLSLRSVCWVVFVVYLASLVWSLARHEPSVWEKWSQERASLVHHLEQDGDHHLVIVRYWPGHRSNREWVYNKADIDGSRVVLARDMDPEHNRQLLDYFKDRRIWLFEPDAEPPMLQPYPSLNGGVEGDASRADSDIKLGLEPAHPSGG
jgi:hypothetical protein